MDAPKLRGTKEEHKRVSATGAKAMAVKATWHVKLTRGDHARTAFTDYLNRVPKRGAIETVHVDGERVKLRIDVVHEQTHTRAASLGVFDVLATEVD
jgi:hypothetical protein